jgi:hypothetical protein
MTTRASKSRSTAASANLSAIFGLALASRGNWGIQGFLFESRRQTEDSPGPAVTDGFVPKAAKNPAVSSLGE